MAGSSAHKPIVQFYSGGENIDSIMYSDAMVALAGRADFGLDTDDGPDLAMTGVPHKTEIMDHMYPRVLIVKPRFTIDQIADMAKKMHPGQSMPPLVEFDWECMVVHSAKEYAAMIGAEMQKLGY